MCEVASTTTGEQFAAAALKSRFVFLTLPAQFLALGTAFKPCVVLSPLSPFLGFTGPVRGKEAGDDPLISLILCVFTACK